MYEFEAIGTHWWIERLDGQMLSDDIRSSLERYTAEFDQRYSRFRDDSLVLELMRTGRLTHPPEEMLQMLAFGEDLQRNTNGAFSLFVGSSLQSLGYGLREALPQKVHNEMSWTRKAVKVSKGTILDFGGLGKGWLIDVYADILRAHGVQTFIINGGGDVYVEADEPVELALEDPFDAGKMIGSVHIKKGALAASSTIKRAWKRGGKAQHHIIDPATGLPTKNNVVASFVLADTALVADALATILIIRPELQEKLEALYHAKARLVTRN